MINIEILINSSSFPNYSAKIKFKLFGKLESVGFLHAIASNGSEKLLAENSASNGAMENCVFLCHPATMETPMDVKN